LLEPVFALPRSPSEQLNPDSGASNTHLGVYLAGGESRMDRVAFEWIRAYEHSIYEVNFR
jgi:hypothetical protein